MNKSTSVASISNNIYEELGKSFPISCTSDEFYYFPQVIPTESRWSTWDNFSPDNIREFVQKLSTWENEIKRLTLYESDFQTLIDINILKSLTNTLKEQLSVVKSWEYQPTFYLSIACIGLAEAIESEDPAAKHERAKNLAHFLEQASRNLNRIPILFRNIGFQMISTTRKFLLSVSTVLAELAPALDALNRLEDKLKRVRTCRDFTLTDGLFEWIVRHHLHCDMDLIEINDVLDHEINAMRDILGLKYGNLDVDKLKAQISSQTRFMPANNSLVEIYNCEIDRGSQHCIDQNLVYPSLVASCPVRVTTMPSFLSTIHGAAIYSIPPRYPPRGGTFYIFQGNKKSRILQKYLREYKMTCAHETYPGHHLLDISRWGLSNSLRRSIELPIFYEGWACFAEELMRLTGYFSSPIDKLLLARRRLMHALRAKVDVGLQSRTMSLPMAAAYLNKTGISRQKALSLVRKYTLNPGYQICYTVGLRRFINLFNKYAQGNTALFVKFVLSQGEICFTDLEKAIREYYIPSLY